MCFRMWNTSWVWAGLTSCLSSVLAQHSLLPLVIDQQIRIVRQPWRYRWSVSVVLTFVLSLSVNCHRAQYQSTSFLFCFSYVRANRPLLLLLLLLLLLRVRSVDMVIVNFLLSFLSPSSSKICPSPIYVVISKRNWFVIPCVDSSGFHPFGKSSNRSIFWYCRLHMLLPFIDAEISPRLQSSLRQLVFFFNIWSYSYFFDTI